MREGDNETDKGFPNPKPHEHEKRKIITHRKPHTKTRRYVVLRQDKTRDKDQDLFIDYDILPPPHQ